MIKRHEDQLWARLDELYTRGTTFIANGELYHWYNVERVSKTPWRDIRARWTQLLEERGRGYEDPKVAELDGGVSLFFARKPSSLSEKAA